MPYILQTPEPGPQKVELSDEQFVQLIEQLQGIGFYLSGWLAVGVMLLAGLVLIKAVGGR